MAEAALNAMAQQLVDLTLCKTRYDAWDLQWYTEGRSGEEQTCVIPGSIRLSRTMRSGT